MRPPPVVVPIRDWADRLPFKCVAGLLDRQAELPAGAHNGAQCAIAADECRPNGTGMSNQPRANDRWHQCCSSAISSRARASTANASSTYSACRLECQRGSGLAEISSAFGGLALKLSIPAPTAGNCSRASIMGVQSNGMLTSRVITNKIYRRTATPRQ